MFGLGAALGIGTSLIGGALGYKDAKDAEAQGKAYHQQSLQDQRDRGDVFRKGYEMSRPYEERYLDEASSLEGDLLDLVDPVTSAEVRRIQQETRQAEAQASSVFASRGMDSFTTRYGAQQDIRGQSSNALTDLATRMSSQRMSAMTTGRSTLLGALGRRSAFETGYADRQGSVYDRMSQLNAGVQYQPANTGANVGELGKLITQVALTDFT